MDYEVLFEDSAVEDLADIAIREAHLARSVSEGETRADALVDGIVSGLSMMPERNPQRAYGFTSVLRRAYTVDKYTAFYWVDEAAPVVHVEKIAHAKANFNRFHFGN